MENFIISALATWRVSHMINSEYGPGGIFKILREHFGVEHDVDGEIVSYIPNTMIVCMWCVSIWIGIVFAVLPKWLARPFAFSAIAVLIHDFRSK